MGGSRIPYELICNEFREDLFLIKQSGLIYFTNDKAKLETGYEEELIGSVITSIFPKALVVQGDHIEVLRNSIEDLEENNQTVQGKTFAYRKNLTCYPVWLKLTWIELEGEMLGICIATNMTELNTAKKRERLAMEELREAMEIKNVFLANITHELRTPVNGMKGLADVLIDTRLTKVQRDNVNIIRRCCDNMSNMINEILDFSKITAGKMQLEYAIFDFPEFIKNTLAYHLPVLNEKGLKIQVNLGKDIPKQLLGDELRLEQVLHNLISNAIKFTTVGQIIIDIVVTYQTEEEVELFFMIIDSGIGIAKEDMDKLFHSFSQVDGSITRKYGGTGLGLAISKMLIELMGGSIHVSSEKGKGSTFSFSAKFKMTSESISQEGKDEDPHSMIFEQEDGNAKNLTLKMTLSEQMNEEETKLNIPLVLDYLEKLSLCVELGTWEKAEKFAGTMKQIIPLTEKEMKKSAFRLELAVRKEDYDNAIRYIEELQAYF